MKRVFLIGVIAAAFLRIGERAYLTIDQSLGSPRERFRGSTFASRMKIILHGPEQLRD
jgi:hypothetical protein